MRKLPGLHVGRRALGTRSTVDLVESVHVQLPDEARELREVQVIKGGISTKGGKESEQRKGKSRYVKQATYIVVLEV